MPVFISYRRLDHNLAEKLHEFFRAQRIPCYWDQVDEELMATKQITKVILRRIKECTHLIAVISTQTKASWWVPFEIGAASTVGLRIATFRRKDVSYEELPEYLRKWPVVHKKRHLEKYVMLYRADRKGVGGYFELGDNGNYIGSYYEADVFHTELMEYTGQETTD